MRTYPSGVCATTMTERFAKSCDCPTYPENLGPCADHTVGENGRCVYCDHEMTCKPARHESRWAFVSKMAQALGLMGRN